MRLLAKTRESSTLQMLLPAIGLLLYKFATTDMDPNSFAMAFATLLAVWLGREWKSAHYKEDINAPKG